MRMWCGQCQKKQQHRQGNLGEMICKKCGCWRSSEIRNNYPKLQAKYNELIFEVCRKFPGESRHQTALRYIREAERIDMHTCQAGSN